MQLSASRSDSKNMANRYSRRPTIQKKDSLFVYNGASFNEMHKNLHNYYIKRVHGIYNRNDI